MRLAPRRRRGPLRRALPAPAGATSSASRGVPLARSASISRSRATASNSRRSSRTRAARAFSRRAATSASCPRDLSAARERFVPSLVHAERVAELPPRLRAIGIVLQKTKGVTNRVGAHPSPSRPRTSGTFPPHRRRAPRTTKRSREKRGRNPAVPCVTSRTGRQRTVTMGDFPRENAAAGVKNPRRRVRRYQAPPLPVEFRLRMSEV